MSRITDLTNEMRSLLVELIEAGEWYLAGGQALTLIVRLRDEDKPLPRGFKHVSLPAGNIPGYVYHRVALINTLIDQRKRKKP